MESVIIRGSDFPAEIELYRVAFRTDGIDVGCSVYAFDPLNESLARFMKELAEAMWIRLGNAPQTMSKS
ncbi:MAG: hypothetical protein H0V76_02420 [Blastocatellia bacterium]|nr:hypothetical protein [Blastocatellia bacterium]